MDPAMAGALPSGLPTAMSKRGKQRGHFCWCCGRIRPNETFSGRGRARHLCRDCAKLGAAELAYRQAARDIDRLVDWNGVVRRKQRKSFERFLSHPDERVRRYAAEVAARDAQAREAFRQESLAEEAAELAWERAALQDDGDPSWRDDEVGEG
jgi:hypothetical protein